MVVTGGSGKLGKWVVQELVSHGHDVANVDRSHPSNSNGVCCLIADVQDLGQVYGALSGADAVIHLAGIYSHGITTDDVTFRTNVLGTFNIHEAAFRLGIKRVVTMSSEAVLGWAPGSWAREHVPHYLPIDEEHPCEPQDCYGLSKLVAESVAKSYTNKCEMETVLIRAPWIVSPEELHNLHQANGRKPEKFALFHYIDVRDLAEACRLSVERPLTGNNVLFVGAGESSVATPLSILYPRLMPQIGDKACKLSERRSSISIEKARQLLGWSPRYSWRTLPA